MLATGPAHASVTSECAAKSKGNPIGVGCGGIGGVRVIRAALAQVGILAAHSVRHRKAVHKPARGEIVPNGGAERWQQDGRRQAEEG